MGSSAGARGRPPGLPTLADLLPHALARRLRNLPRRDGPLEGHVGHCGQCPPARDERLYRARPLLTLAGAAAHILRRRHNRGFHGNHAPRPAATRKKPELAGGGPVCRDRLPGRGGAASHVEVKFGLQVSAAGATSAGPGPRGVRRWGLGTRATNRGKSGRSALPESTGPRSPQSLARACPGFRPPPPESSPALEPGPGPREIPSNVSVRKLGRREPSGYQPRLLRPLLSSRNPVGVGCRCRRAEHRLRSPAGRVRIPVSSLPCFGSQGR